MVLDKRIQQAADELHVRRIEDWANVSPEQVTAIRDVGRVTLDHIRIYLAARGLTLRGDQTPQYWQENLSSTKIGTQLSSEDNSVILPFTILIDNREQQPFTFAGVLADADQCERPLIVPTKSVSLGDTHGDYAIEGMVGEAHIERKSISDAIGTFDSFKERRERWEKTLEFLAGIPTAAVVIEGSIGNVLTCVKARGTRSVKHIRKTLYRQVLSWEQDYRVPFIFCDHRRMAEITTLTLLRRHYRKVFEKKKHQLTMQDLDSMMADI